MSTADNTPAQDFADWLAPRIPNAADTPPASPEAGTETRPGPITDDPNQPDVDFAAWLDQHIS